MNGHISVGVAFSVLYFINPFLEFRAKRKEYFKVEIFHEHILPSHESKSSCGMALRQACSQNDYRVRPNVILCALDT